MNQQGGIAGYPPSPYIVNLIELQNTVNSASGLTGTSALTTAVADLQKMVDFQKKQINTNFLASYDSNSISVLSNMNFTGGATLSIDGTEVTSGGGGSAGNSLTAGRTSIVLQSVSSPLIAMNIQRRPVFTFNQLGNALFFDGSGVANQFAISSARLVADTVAFRGAKMTPAAGRFLYSTDTSGNAVWANVSSIKINNTHVEARSSDNTIRFTNNATESARFTATGYLGLKTTSPAAELDVNGKTRTTTLQVTDGAAVGRYLQATDVNGNSTWVDLTLPTSSNIVAGNTSVDCASVTNQIRFTTAGTQRAVINSSGYLGIGTTNPSYTLDVVSEGRIPTLNTATINASSGGQINITSQILVPAIYTNSITASSGILSVYNDLYVYGNVYAYNYGYISDRNQKNTIRTLENSESDFILKQLQAVRFKWNRNNAEDIGFIAQDVQPIFPEAVGDTPVGLTISYHKFIPLLVESVKSLQSRVSSLEEEIAAIKRRLP